MSKGRLLLVAAWLGLSCGGGEDEPGTLTIVRGTGGQQGESGQKGGGAAGASAGSGTKGGSGPGVGGTSSGSAGSGGAATGGSKAAGSGGSGAAGETGGGSGGNASGASGSGGSGGPGGSGGSGAGGVGQGGAGGGSESGASGAGGSGAGGGAGSGGQAGAPSKPVFFAIIGDFGVDSGNEAVVAEMVKEAKPEFVITLGDNNYPDGKAATIDDNIGKYYAEFIAPYKGAHGPGAATNRFFPSPGNHDWNTGTLDPYLDYFELPGNERYYDIERGPVHLFALDSDSNEPDGTGENSKQGQWLQAKLAASKAPFKIVYFHHPPFSSGEHGNATKLQWPFAAWGVSAVLSGHDHTYERFEIDGIPYIVNGLGGAGLYQFQVVKPDSMVRYNKAHGAMFAEATDDKLTLQARSVEGELIDEVILLKTGAPTQSATLISKGASWRYFDQGKAPAGWQQAGFDASGWAQGKAPLGYGDSGMATTIGFGGNADNKHITAYFQKSFDYDGVVPLSLTYALRRDDGAVIYLNGVEVARNNMPSGAVTASTLADSTVNDAEELAFYGGSIAPSALTSGKNVIAVELHQAAANSSDTVFDLELKAALP